MVLLTMKLNRARSYKGRQLYMQTGETNGSYPVNIEGKMLRTKRWTALGTMWCYNLAEVRLD